MNILVTGGAGYVGSHACKILAQVGHNPVTYDDLSRGHKWAVRWGRLVEGSLCNLELLRRTLQKERIEAVFHFAAVSYVGESMVDPGMYFANNVEGSLRLLRAMQSEGVGKIVFSSSCATYGMPKHLPIEESHPQRPTNPYGESKFLVERALRWYGEIHGLRWATLRYFNAAGCDADGDAGECHNPETHLIPLAIAAARDTSAPLEIFGTDYPTPDGTAIRDYIHVTDLADAHVKALNRLETSPENIAVNLGAGRGYSVRQVLAMVEKVTGRPVPHVGHAKRPGDPPELVAAVQTAYELLDWTPLRSSLENIIRTASDWAARGDCTLDHAPFKSFAAPLGPSSPLSRPPNPQLP